MYDLIIIGGGTAGLSAFKAAKQHTQNILIIEDGPLGTTCARVGCMPSKCLIHAAKLYNSKKIMKNAGIHGGDHLSINIPEVLAEVRRKRDYFTGFVKRNTEALGDKLILGTAEFIDEHTIKVNDCTYKTKATVIATGSRPFIPEQFEKFADKIITSDTVFEQRDFPKRIGLIGLGVIGMELAQALGKLGVKVIGTARSPDVKFIKDDLVNNKLIEALSRDFDLWYSCMPEVSKHKDGLLLKSDDREAVVDKLLVTTGRVANLEKLKLENAGVKYDRAPDFDPLTLQIKGKPIYIAGDVNYDKAILHEAADEGVRAAMHALGISKKKNKRMVNMGIIFTDPVTAFIGDVNAKNTVVGHSHFEDQGRATVEDKNLGTIAIYADKKSGRLTAAEMVCPAAEHFAHFISLVITKEMTVEEVLQLPFYHPTFEEGLRTALRETLTKLTK